MIMKGRRIGVVCSLSLSFLTALAAFPQAKWKGIVVEEGDVTIVKNPKEPIYKTPILELKEDLSIGGPEAKGQDVFDRIGEFVVDDVGNFYISDRMDYHVKVFDGSGRYLRTVGRRGQGPGEFDGLGTLSIVGTTGELAVANVLKRCLTFFKTDGTYVRDLHFEEPRTFFAILDSKGNIYAGETFDDTGTSRSEYRMVVLNPEGKRHLILAKTPGADRTKFELFKPSMFWRLDSSDNLVYGYSGNYEIQFYKAGTCRLVKKVRKDFDPVPVSAEERKKFERPEFGDMNVVIAKDHPAFRSFFLSDTGHLFVETFEKAGDGNFIHDIFDRDGRLLARISLKPRGLKISNGRYFALEEDENGFQYVKRYSVTWKVK